MNQFIFRHILGHIFPQKKESPPFGVGDIKKENETQKKILFLGR